MPKMSKIITIEDLSELIIYTDAIHEVLKPYGQTFRHGSKFEFNKVEKAVKNIISVSFGEKDVGELDDFVFEVRQFAQNLIKNKVYFND